MINKQRSSSFSRVLLTEIFMARVFSTHDICWCWLNILIHFYLPIEDTQTVVVFDLINIKFISNIFGIIVKILDNFIYSIK